LFFLSFYNPTSGIRVKPGLPHHVPQGYDHLPGKMGPQKGGVINMGYPFHESP
jgi:hypothetical protein